VEKHEDERGFFARAFCQKEFSELGLEPRFVQCNISYNKKKGTLKGMHYQAHPHEEAKLVRCSSGAIYDVVIDLRKDSSTFKEYFSIELAADSYTMLYVPKGFAHGFITLADDTEVFYQMSEFYEPTAARGLRWNDPAFGINWPIDVSSISEKDKTYSDFIDK